MAQLKKIYNSKNFRILIIQYGVVIVSCLFLAGVLFPYSTDHFNVFNTIVEMIYIFISVAMFLVVWHTYERMEPVNIIYGFGFLGIAVLDILVIVFSQLTGLDYFVYHDLAIKYWILARIGEGIVLRISTTKFFQVKLNKWLSLLIAIIVTLSTLSLVYQFRGYLPILLNKNGTFTEAKILLEYVAIFLYLLILYTLRTRLDDRNLITYRNIILALIISVHAEISFINAVSFPFLITFGHLLKVASFYFLYRGIFVRAITYPHEKLEQSKEKINFQANLLDQVRNAIIATDLIGKITYWNKFAVQLFGWQSSEVLNKKIWEVIIPSGESNFSLLKEKIKKDGYIEGDYLLHTKTGNNLIVNSVITMLKNEDGTPHGLVAICTDITDRKELEEKIAHLDRLNFVGEMAASIGHEIRNPLTSVKGFLQLIAGKKKASKEKEYLEICIMELDRANSIITEYLSLAKNKKIDVEPSNLNTIINTVIPLLEADAILYNKDIKLELGEIPDINVDKKECLQLIVNLVRNGLEAMDSGGQLTIKTFQEGKEIILAITDQGQGIPEEILVQLGTPFVTTKENGTGLGLAVCYSIAARHNASISAETGPFGTTFFVRFQV